MMSFVKPASVLSAGLLLAAIGCKGGDSTSSAPAAPFASAQAVLTTRCMPCHSGAQPAAGIDLTKFDSISRTVTPGDPTNSKLVQVMRGAPGVKKMPPSGPPPSEQEIKAVEAWIQAGAKQA